MQSTSKNGRAQSGWSLGSVLPQVLSLGLVGLGLYLLLSVPGRSASTERSSIENVAAQTAISPSPVPALRAIEAIQVGDRVLAGNPEGAEPEPEVDPPTWRKLILAMHSHGVDVDITLLRSLDWIRANQAAVGGTVELNLPEMDMVGPARLLSIDPCPPLKVGSGRVVTGTFAHDDGAVLDLRLQRLIEPIGVTSNHPLWSEDRHKFVRAAELKIGERLKPLSGGTSVASINPRPGTHRVYNLEVNGEHAYRITSAGVLVHNSCGLTGVTDKEANALGGAIRGIEVNGQSAVRSVEAFGSRAGSTFRARPPHAGSDLDLFVTLGSTVVNSAAARRQVMTALDDIADLWRRSKGFPLQIVQETDTIADSVKAGLLNTPFIPLGP